MVVQRELSEHENCPECQDLQNMQYRKTVLGI